MKITFNGVQPRPKPTLVGLLEWQKKDLKQTILNHIYSDLEKAMPKLEAALNQAAKDAVQAFYDTYTPKQYRRTRQLPIVYDIHCQFDKNTEILNIDGDDNPKAELIQYYSEADHGKGPEHRPLNAQEMRYVVGGLTNGIRFYPKWRNPPRDYPSTYGPISITFQLTNTQCTGMSIQEILTGDDMDKAIDAYFYEILFNAIKDGYYDWLDNSRDIRGWNVRFKEV